MAPWAGIAAALLRVRGGISAKTRVTLESQNSPPRARRYFQQAGASGGGGRQREGEAHWRSCALHNDRCAALLRIRMQVRGRLGRCSGRYAVPRRTSLSCSTVWNQCALSATTGTGITDGRVFAQPSGHGA